MGIFLRTAEQKRSLLKNCTTLFTIISQERIYVNALHLFK